MDTSEQYIKMCEKAVEIQGLRTVGKHYKLGDYYFWEDHINLAYGNGETVGIEYRYADETWLPRQDQLQEMIIDKFKNTGFSAIESLVFKFYKSFEADTEMSMEQLWLAFVMKEKYNKSWNGEGWVINS